MGVSARARVTQPSKVAQVAPAPSAISSLPNMSSRFKAGFSKILERDNREITARMENQQEG